jgi:hypothetical protein
MCCDKIHKFVSILHKYKIKKNYIECIYLFINLLVQHSTNEKPEIFFDILEDFLKRIKDLKKKSFNEKMIINKIYECSIDADGPTLFVNYIFTE